MSNKFRINQQGVSLKFVFDRGCLPIDGWICTINVVKAPGDTPIISREIPAVGGAWPGFLTSTETAALDEGAYRLVGVLTNSATDQEESPIIRFNITTAWAA